MSDENQEVVPPVAAPVAAPTPAPTQAVSAGAPAPAEPQAVVPYTYEPIEGDPGLTMALQFVGKLGITPDSLELQSAMKGDFTFIKAKLASLGASAAGFEHYIALAEKSFDTHVKTGAEKIAAAATAIHAAVGGEDQWKTIQEWASKNADDGEKEQINSMLNAGGFQARAAAALLHQMHSNAIGVVVNPASATVPNVAGGSNAVAAAGAPLSPEAFQKEVAALVGKHGMHAAQSSPEMAALRQRRQNYR